MSGIVTGTIRLAEVVYAEDHPLDGSVLCSGASAEDGRDGTVVYLVDAEYAEGRRRELRVGQRFHRDAEPDGDESGRWGNRPMWSWDGDRDEPTLRPSFGWGHIDGRGWLIHLHLTGGEIEPVDDMLLEVINDGST